MAGEWRLRCLRPWRLRDDLLLVDEAAEVADEGHGRWSANWTRLQEGAGASREVSAGRFCCGRAGRRMERGRGVGVWLCFLDFYDELCYGLARCDAKVRKTWIPPSEKKMQTYARYIKRILKEKQD